MLKMIEYFDDRFYRFTKIKNGERIEYAFPSVTTKLGVTSKPYLYRFYADLGWENAQRRIAESQNKGIRIHAALHILVKGGVVIFNPPRNPTYSQEDISKLRSSTNDLLAIMNYQDEFLDVLKIKKFFEMLRSYEIAGSEMTVFDEINDEAGTLDLLINIKDKVVIPNGRNSLEIGPGYYVADLKTGNTVDDDAYMQTAAYAKMIPGKSPVGTLILHTGSKTRTGIEGLAIHLRTKPEMDLDYQDFRAAARLWERKNPNMEPKVLSFPSEIKL